MQKNNILIIILLLTAFLRFFRLDFPKVYAFDEVYHGFTAKEYLYNHKEAWEYWTSPPPGVAYEWTHPPMSKEIMALSMGIFKNTAPLFYRLPGALFGVLSVLLVYHITQTLFNKKSVSLLSSFIFSVDGLNFVQSRIGMNDVYFITFMLAAILFIIKDRFLLSSISLGLALSSKWTSFYLFGILIILYLLKKRDLKILILLSIPILAFLRFKFLLQIPIDSPLRNQALIQTSLFYFAVLFLSIIFLKKYRSFLYFIFIPPIIYLSSYIPFFLLGHSFEQFFHLQQQMWWYHTGLKATHDYASPWWSWPFNLYPVWYYVDYSGSKVANIFASGNPVFFWMGFLAIIISLWELIILKSKTLGLYLKVLAIEVFNSLMMVGTSHHKEQIPAKHLQTLNTKYLYALIFIILGYFIFWLPWAFSPRIMFLYHYSPSIPFLSIALGYQLDKLNNKEFKIIYLIGVGSIILGFLVVYPYLTGIHLPRNLMELFFNLNITKNPFK